MTPQTACRGRVLMIGRPEALYAQLNQHLDLCRLEVISCASATRALKHLWGQPWDVVVTDPSSSTGQCLALARAVSWLRPDVRLIALSPTATTEDIIAAIRAHVFAYFSAPFDPAEIIGVLHTALGASDWLQTSTWVPVCHPIHAAVQLPLDRSPRLVHIRAATARSR